MPLGDLLGSIGGQLLADFFAAGHGGAKLARACDVDVLEQLRQRFAQEVARYPGSVFLGLIDGRTVGLLLDAEEQYRLITIYPPGMRDPQWHVSSNAIDRTEAERIVERFSLKPTDPLQMKMP
jgi:hypothetical protein